ncbi:MAG TPA: hypothetical protein VHV82_18705 [Sporichthyaceae bacterium]|nr:hypothetical protein [Sporichthyaceae bacterium]
MTGTPPTLTPGSTATGAPVSPAVLQAIATSLDSVPGVSYTFAVSGSDMMSAWPSGQGVVQGSPDPGLDAQIQQEMLMGYNSGSMEFRSVGGALYVRSARYDQGKAWALVPADESTNPQAQGMHAQVGQLDPRLQLKLVLASPNMHETTEGTSLPGTTHYVGEVAGAQLASASGLDPGSRAELAAGYPSLAIRALEVDVWVDAQDHPVRLDIISPTPAGSLAMQMNFSGYGTPAGVSPPAADDTIPLPSSS